MLNKTIFIGRFTKDPELRKSTSGKLIASFSVAVDSPLQASDGTRGTTYLECVAFNNQAENIAKYTRKGSKVCVEGSLNQRNYTRTDGSKAKVLEVIVDSIGFLDPKPEAPSDDTFDDDAPMDLCGSLDGEKYKDENGEEKELKFDPYTGKPLKPAKSK